MIEFVIDARAKPAPRPRAKKGQRAYYPQDYYDYLDLVGWPAASAMAGRAPLTCDVSVTIYFAFKGKKRGDIDNLEKAILDGMQGIVYDDDNQVVDVDKTIVIMDAPAIYIAVRETRPARLEIAKQTIERIRP